MNRRQFVTKGSLAAALAHSRLLASLGSDAEQGGASRSFTTNDAGLSRVYEAALATLRANVVRLAAYPGPVLIEGSVYGGVWLECAPQEGEVCSTAGRQGVREAARNNHLIFFALQKEDGQLPCNVKANGPGFGQIQMVVPIAATAWELARESNDSELLEKAYAACGRWDAWLRALSEYPRDRTVRGLLHLRHRPGQQPALEGRSQPLPGGRCAPMSSGSRACRGFVRIFRPPCMAGAWRWPRWRRLWARPARPIAGHEDAETIRRLIVDKLYDPQDGAFYDLDAQNRFVRVRSSAILPRARRACRRSRTSSRRFGRRQVHNPRRSGRRIHFRRSPSTIRVCASDSAQLMGRREAGAHGASRTSLDGALRQTRELAWLMQRWHQALLRAGRIPPADGSPDGRIHPDRSRWIFAGSSGVVSIFCGDCPAFASRTVCSSGISVRLHPRAARSLPRRSAR